MKLEHNFVKNVPQEIEDGILYISMEYSTAIHKCCCGCGNQVVTPFSPVDWDLTFNGETVSLYPSIGNWNFPCKSHYWITESEVRWAPKWSDRQVKEVKRKDRDDKIRHLRKGKKSFFGFLRIKFQ